jgi:hypothetical protein
MEPRFVLWSSILQDPWNRIRNDLSSSIYVDLSTRNIEDSLPDHGLEGNHRLRTRRPKAFGILKAKYKFLRNGARNSTRNCTYQYHVVPFGVTFRLMDLHTVQKQNGRQQGRYLQGQTQVVVLLVSSKRLEEFLETRHHDGRVCG